MNPYISEIIELLELVNRDAKMSVPPIATTISKRIARGGIVQLFGSGHSQLIAQEGFYRAGSLVPVKPISI